MKTNRAHAFSLSLSLSLSLSVWLFLFLSLFRVRASDSRHFRSGFLRNHSITTGQRPRTAREVTKELDEVANETGQGRRNQFTFVPWELSARRSRQRRDDNGRSLSAMITQVNVVDTDKRKQTLATFVKSSRAITRLLIPQSLKDRLSDLVLSSVKSALSRSPSRKSSPHRPDRVAAA